LCYVQRVRDEHGTELGILLESGAIKPLPNASSSA